MSDLKVIIEELKYKARLDGEEGEDERGTEFREEKPAFIPEYLRTKKLTCSVCSRNWTVVIYMDKGVEKLLHPSEIKCSYCLSKLHSDELFDIAGKRLVPWYWLYYRKDDKLKTMIDKEEEAFKRLKALPKCTHLDIDKEGDKAIYKFSDGSVIERPLVFG